MNNSTHGAEKWDGVIKRSEVSYVNGVFGLPKFLAQKLLFVSYQATESR